MKALIASRSAARFGVALLVPALLAGCDRAAEHKAPAARSAPEVVVAEVVKKTIPVLMDFPGTVQSVRTVDIIPRVSGYIEKRSFEEGTFVEKGAPLYEIDPRPFRAALDSAEAQLKKDRASEAFWHGEAKRYTRLAKAGAGSQEDKEKANAQLAEVRATIAADLADVETAKLNLAYTSISAPFAGRIENTRVYAGDVVTAQKDVLSTLVQIDPIHVTFEVSRRLTAKVQGMRLAGLAPKALSEFEAHVRLSDGATYRESGHLDFVSAQVDAATDTSSARAVFPNHHDGTTQITLLPGQYVPLTLTAGKQPDAILVPAAALIQSQIGSQVFVVGSDGKVEARTVEIDRSYDHQWVISKGLEGGERVVVSGLQKIRSGMAVKIKDPEQQRAKS